MPLPSISPGEEVVIYSLSHLVLLAFSVGDPFAIFSQLALCDKYFIQPKSIPKWWEKVNVCKLFSRPKKACSCAKSLCYSLPYFTVFTQKSVHGLGSAVFSEPSLSVN